MRARNIDAQAVRRVPLAGRYRQINWVCMIMGRPTHYNDSRNSRDSDHNNDIANAAGYEHREETNHGLNGGVALILLIKKLSSGMSASDKRKDVQSSLGSRNSSL